MGFKNIGEENEEVDFNNFFNQNRSPKIDISDRSSSFNKKTPIIINATQNITSNHNTYINNIPQSNEETMADTENVIVVSPRLELKLINQKNEKEKQTIQVTPNSINNVIKKVGEKFLFGRNDPKMKNDYNFFDDSVGVRQFEIYYEKGIIS
jgi:hypothetical protein